MPCCCPNDPLCESVCPDGEGGSWREQNVLSWIMKTTTVPPKAPHVVRQLSSSTGGEFHEAAVFKTAGVYFCAVPQRAAATFTCDLWGDNSLGGKIPVTYLTSSNSRLWEWRRCSPSGVGRNEKVQTEGRGRTKACVELKEKKTTYFFGVRINPFFFSLLSSLMCKRTLYKMS